MDDVTTFNVSCLCGGFHRSLSVPKSPLPLTGVFCHCNICRHVSGGLCTSYALLPSTPGPASELRKYESSDNCTRLFCGSCGAHVFAYLKAADLWLLATGVLDEGNEIVRFQAHSWVGDTLDEGLSTWLPTLYGQEVVRYSTGSQSGELFQPPHTSTPTPKSNDRKPTPHLHATCHCRGVQFHLTRPDAASKTATSHWPDLLAPYHSASAANPSDVKWWLRAHDTKYLAGLCTCASCRRASGFDVQAWAFVPRLNILNNDTGKPLDFTTPLGTLRRYESSKGTYREFCGGCGATVFWWSEERPELIDVAVGLLEAGSGARAEEWLEWWRERVSFMEEARDGEVVRGLVDGLRAGVEERRS